MNKTEIQNVKLRFGIIGNTEGLNRAIDIAMQVAPTDLSVLVTGESGVGKESFPQIIHQFSRRKHGPYIAVNCGAIPEGTIDSELFGHEKGAFTGAISDRNGYFAEANGGTIFLDEVGELPLSTQARLLRVLESGEYIKVGSSKVQKTDVRIVAATNVDFTEAIANGRFREDLYYRLNTVPIKVPPLRERPNDIALLFRKFASDFAEKYRMPAIQLTEDAKQVLTAYSWPGNIRQLKNVAETVSALESEKLSARTERFEINADVLSAYIPKDDRSMLPVKSNAAEETVSPSEREAMIRMIYQLRQEVDYLKEIVLGHGAGMLPRQLSAHGQTAGADRSLQEDADWQDAEQPDAPEVTPSAVINLGEGSVRPAFEDQGDPGSLSLEKAGEDLIRKALEKYKGNRKLAAAELGISERTLYRKLKNIGE